MGSNGERPEFKALEELEDAIRQVSEELAVWRARAQKAEGGTSPLSSDGDLASTRARVAELEGENEKLLGRIQHARVRVTDLLTRLRFLEEQTAPGGRRR